MNNASLPAAAYTLLLPSLSINGDDDARSNVRKGCGAANSYAAAAGDGQADGRFWPPFLSISKPHKTRARQHADHEPNLVRGKSITIKWWQRREGSKEVLIGSLKIGC